MASNLLHALVGACLPRTRHIQKAVYPMRYTVFCCFTRSPEPELFCFSRRESPVRRQASPCRPLFQLYYRNARFALAVNAKAEAAHIFMTAQMLMNAFAQRARPFAVNEVQRRLSVHHAVVDKFVRLMQSFFYRHADQVDFHAGRTCYLIPA